MPAMTAKEFLPVELVFNPNWWYRTAGISFDKSFYFDAETCMQNDMTMRGVLYEGYGDLGLGEPDPQPRPIIGSLHVAGGFVIPALLGVEIDFSPNTAADTRQPVGGANRGVGKARLQRNLAHESAHR